MLTPINTACAASALACIRQLVKPGTSPSGAAAELEDRRVSGFWLRQYISPELQKATACLSLFAATFDAVGASAVLHGPDATSQQQEDAVKMLRGLRGVSVVQEVQQAAPPGQLRYSMHPLVRALAVELRYKWPEDDKDAAAVGFVVYMLCQSGAELYKLGQTAATAPVAAQLLSRETPKFRSHAAPRRSTRAVPCWCHARRRLAAGCNVQGCHG